MNTAAEFWDNTMPVPPSDCLLWLGGVHPRGYGALTWQGHRGIRASRLAFFLTHGHWPTVCRHSCDTPLCVNPAHLLDGIQADNIADMDRKGRRRSLKGTENGRAKFSEDVLAAVRAATGSQESIARQFGMHQTHVSRIKRGIR